MLAILITIGKAIAVPSQWFWFKATPKMKAVIVAILLVLSVIGYIVYLRSQVQELKDENLEIQLNNDLEKVDETLKDANRKEANFNGSAAEANRIRNANYANTSLTEAQKARCRAYPESRECQK